MGAFLYKTPLGDCFFPQKTSVIQGFSDIFNGNKKERLGWNGLKDIWKDRSLAKELLKIFGTKFSGMDQVKFVEDNL